MQLCLELGSFILLDPVFAKETNKADASAMFNFMVKLQNKLAESNSEQMHEGIFNVIARIRDQENLWKPILAKLLESGSL